MDESKMMDIHENRVCREGENPRSKSCSDVTPIVDRRAFLTKKKSSLRSLDNSSTRRLEMGDLNVRFSSVAVRDYSMTIGDNPSVSRGVPISLGWEYDKEHSYDINKFEDDRCGERRESEELKLPSLQRVQLLKTMGYSRGEIKEQTKEVQKVKDERFSTRRRIERADKVKKVLKLTIDRVTNIIPTTRPKAKAKTALPGDTEDDTLASSMSSRKSDF
mmetsp:Transcript_18582/g.46088  ORF Transcript_18582/g.46088 Transcript_18582/m.46088 type:complete len:218 (-) Transcript_18582:194-847(-)